MESLSTNVVGLLQYLMPGFLAAWVLYFFTSHKKPSQFERIVEALIFTLFIQAAVHGLEMTFLWLGRFHSFGPWTKHSDLCASIIWAILIGLIAAYCINNDHLHKVARWVGMSQGSAYPSDWYGIFAGKATYVVLHLKDGRRIYGYPKIWPASPSGHFSLEQASWLCDDNQQVELDTVEAILISAVDVQMVEFMKK